MDVIVKRVPEFDVTITLNIKVVKGLIGRIVNEFPPNAIEVNFPPFGNATILSAWVTPCVEQPYPALERVLNGK